MSDIKILIDELKEKWDKYYPNSNLTMDQFSEMVRNQYKEAITDLSYESWLEKFIDNFESWVTSEEVILYD